MLANMDQQESSGPSNVVCDLCAEIVKDYIFNPCTHVFCWPCISKYRAESSSCRSNCPTCYSNQPLQLVSTNGTGQLQLEESAVQRCFLECEDRPVYVISVVGERRTGKSFLMNYLMRVLHNLEKQKVTNLGGENNPLNGFPWRPGSEKVTDGIWIWGKPFLLENNGKKMAVFLVDTEGTENTKCHEFSSIKLFVLTMMISSHLIYSDPMENDPFHPFAALKYFDILVRDWHVGENGGADVGTQYIEEQIQKLDKRDMKSVLKLVEERIVRCFLMPYPGDAIAEGERARLIDMVGDFQTNLRTFLMDVVERTQICHSFMTCRKMAAKLQVCVEYVQNGRRFSSPLELCDRLKTEAETNTEKEMERLKIEFQDFLKDQTRWRLPNQMSTVVSEKVSEVIKNFHERSLLIREEHHQNLMGKLLDQLQEEGDKFCETHRKDLKYAGLKAAVHVGLTAAATAAMPFLLPAAAPAAAAGGLFSTIGGWFSAAPAATAATSGFAVRVVVGGVTVLQAGAAFMLRRFW